MNILDQLMLIARLLPAVSAIMGTAAKLKHELADDDGLAEDILDVLDAVEEATAEIKEALGAAGKPTSKG